MIYGLDTLGIAAYPDIKRIAKTWPKDYALGAFATVFGDARKAVREVIDSGRCPIVRIQLIYRGNHQYGDRDIPELKQLAKQYSNIATKYPSVNFYLSPFCEHNLKAPDKYLDIIEAAAPNCTPVNSVLDGSFSRNYFDEVHGLEAPSPPDGGSLFSYDGNSANKGNIKQMQKRMKAVQIFYVWHARFNGKIHDADPTPIGQRKAWPDAKFIKEMADLVR